MVSLGIDTSNYTTSVSVIDDMNIIENRKIVLDVKKGEVGLRQSDVVFHHTKNIYSILDKIDYYKIDNIGVSVKPRDIPGSYMPCFLAGMTVAKSISKFLDIPLYGYSHQHGHIMAALVGLNMTESIYKKLIVVHLSGGTCEFLYYDNFRIDIVGGSNDITVGQLIDRVGTKLGYSFPCGKELDDNTVKPDKKYIKVKNTGRYFNISGLENDCNRLLDQGKVASDVCDFLISNVLKVIDNCLSDIVIQYPSVDILFVGGVSSNSYIKEYFSNKYNAYFADPVLSSDNAVGVGALANIEHEGI